MGKMTIGENKVFQKAYRKGKNFVSAVLVTYVLPNQKKSNRYGITSSKKIGCAVKRNRARRIIREAFFHLEQDLPKGYDFIFVARLKTTFVKQQSVEAAMRDHFRKGGLLPGGEKQAEKSGQGK